MTTITPPSPPPRQCSPAVDVQAGERVLDVAAGNGNASPTLKASSAVDDDARAALDRDLLAVA